MKLKRRIFNIKLDDEIDLLVLESKESLFL